MADNKIKDPPPIKIGPEDLERILKNLEDQMIKEEKLRKGDSSFLKKTSMIDKGITERDEKTDFLFRLMANVKENPRVEFVSSPSAEDERNQMSLNLFQKPFEYLDEKEREALDEAIRNSLKSGGRVRLGGGGSPYDDPLKEIALLEGMVGLRPNNSLEAFYIEEMKDRLDYLKRLVEEDK